jgi:choline dehydrogenase-like flavoprotein
MDSHKKFDFIIIGTGAGGATIAHQLAPSGKKILVIERGGYLPREPQNWSSKAVFGEARYQAKETWFDKDGKTFHPGIHYFVGGNTKVFGAALFRLRKEDFSEIIHHGGISPAWPVTYENFEPYYAKAEALYHVHGKHGVDPTDPPFQDQYKYSPVRHEPRIQELHDRMVQKGLHPFPLPLGVMLEEDVNGIKRDSPCIRCNAFDGYPCLVEGKSDSEVIAIRPSLKFPNVELLTHALVKKLKTDSSGKVIKTVVVERNQKTEEYSGQVVIVACGAINSALLLLRSANDKHPQGLANSSDLVGRNYMRHNNTAFMALSKKPNPTIFQKTLGLNDFYHATKEWPFPMGHIQLLGKSRAGAIKAEAPPWVFWKPNFIFEQIAKHSVDFWLTSEDLPDPNNRVTVNSDDQVTLHLTENNMEAHRRLIKKLKSILGHLDLHKHILIPRSVYLGKEIPIGGTAHQCGTLRFGNDSNTSVLDTNCKAHDLDNLYVVDGSFFVSAGAVNPALTIMANAIRVGEHLLQIS